MNEGRVQISVDDLLADRLQEYVNRGWSVRDSLRQALSDVAGMLGLSGIELTDIQFETLACDVEARIAAWKQAQDSGKTMVAPGVQAEVVSPEQYAEEVRKRGLLS